MKPDKLKQRNIAIERVEKLFSLAREVFNEDQKLADRYVALARKMAMKFKLKLPRELKRQFCKHCGSYWMPGKTVRIRTQRGKVVYFCTVCKQIARLPYLREKGSRRAK